MERETVLKESSVSRNSYSNNSGPHRELRDVTFKTKDQAASSTAFQSMTLDSESVMGQ